MTLIRRAPWLLLLLAVSLPAGAKYLFPLSYELDDGIRLPYGSVEVEAVGGGLDLRVSIDRGILGAAADIHELYFNLGALPSDLTLTQPDATRTPFSLIQAPSVRGGAGYAFAYGVNFGNGAGPRGNGALQTAALRLSSATEILDYSFFSPSTRADRPPLYFALHVQGTATPAGSETIGAGPPGQPPGGGVPPADGPNPVPEPATAVLLGGGVALLGLLRRRRTR